MNATFKESSVTLQKSIDISVAVATPNGLITPIVTDALNRDIVNISNTVKVYNSLTYSLFQTLEILFLTVRIFVYLFC